MPSVNPRALSYEGIVLRLSDFTDGQDAGSTLSAGNVAELFTAEIGEDGQLSGYDAIRLGDRADANDPAKGKMYISLVDDTGTDLPDDTEVRFRFRDKNNNRAPPASPWFPLRDLDQSDPRLRRALRPRTKNGNPWYIKNGRILVVEVKNESQDITPGGTGQSHILETPARGGY